MLLFKLTIVRNLYHRIFSRRYVMTQMHFYRFLSVGKVELFTKHDHTQYKLLASAKDPKYSQTSLHFLSFASHINTNIDFFHNCKTLPTYIDTQMATKYAPIGHPLLLDDPHFDAPIDKRNCMHIFTNL